MVKEALKTKDPSVSTNLTFTGKYVILTTGKRKIGASSKLPKEKREKLLKIVEDFLSGKEQIPYGVIIRTNAAQASKEELLLELAQLEAEVQKIISGAKYLIRYSLVHKEEQPWQKMLNGLYETELGEVVTDDREIFETIWSPVIMCMVSETARDSIGISVIVPSAASFLAFVAVITESLSMRDFTLHS